MVTSTILALLLLVWGFTFAVRRAAPTPQRVRAPRRLTSGDARR